LAEREYTMYASIGMRLSNIHIYGMRLSNIHIYAYMYTYIEDKAFCLKKRTVGTNEHGQMNQAYKTRFFVLSILISK
jgi:hypothetical protein